MLFAFLLLAGFKLCKLLIVCVCMDLLAQWSPWLIASLLLMGYTLLLVLYTLCRILVALVLFIALKLVALLVERVWASISRIYSCAGSLSVVARLLLLRRASDRARTYGDWHALQLELDALEGKGECNRALYDWQSMLELTLRLRALRRRINRQPDLEPEEDAPSVLRCRRSAPATLLAIEDSVDNDEDLKALVRRSEVHSGHRSNSDTAASPSVAIEMDQLDKIDALEGEERKLHCLQELMRLIQVRCHSMTFRYVVYLIASITA